MASDRPGHEFIDRNGELHGHRSAGRLDHTYQVDAVDAATNASVLSDVSADHGPAPDMTPPGDPGIATGVSNSTSTIDLIWAAAVDNVGAGLTSACSATGRMRSARSRSSRVPQAR